MYSSLNFLSYLSVIMFVINNATGWNLEWLDMLSCIVFVLSYSACYLLLDRYKTKLQKLESENHDLKTNMIRFEQRISNLENK